MLVKDAIDKLRRLMGKVVMSIIVNNGAADTVMSIYIVNNGATDTL